MRRTFWLLAFAVFSGWSGLALAQAAGSPSPPRIVLKGGDSQANCPVGFSAHRYGLTATLRYTGKNSVRSVPTQSLRLQFDAQRTGRIEAMTVRVYGTSGHPQVVPAGTTAAPDVVSGPMELTSSNGRFDPVQDVTTTTVPMITRIEITEIRYKDGSTWRAPARGACTAVPSLFVLVDAEGSAP